MGARCRTTLPKDVKPPGGFSFLAEGPVATLYPVQLLFVKPIGGNNFALRYVSDTTATWENQDFLPRASIVRRAMELTDGQALDPLRCPDFRPDQLALVSGG